MSAVINDSDKYIDVLKTLNENIDISKYQILIKPHQYVYKKLPKKEKENGRYIPQYIDTNELLSIVDILISDYSSIYFDFMLTRRPILFYIPDFDEYSSKRGIYFKPEELPGPVTSDLYELSNLINNIDSVKDEYKKIYEQTKIWACEYDDGNVSRRILDIIFNRKNDFNIIANFKTDKIKLLFYPGSMDVNGLTEVFLTFINMLDYDKFDVSVCCLYKNTNNIYRITDRARVLCRYGSYTASYSGYYKMYYVEKNGLNNKFKNKIDNIYKNEFKRCFGNSIFDYVIDFSGYGVFFAVLLSQAANAGKIIWQHNDLQKDFNNKNKELLSGNTRPSREAMLSVYEKYDKIVSVGKSLMKVNKEYFSNENILDKYTYVNNPINFNRIKECLISDSNDSDKNHSFNIPTDKNAYKFVTMGRLSSEKNHSNLIKAFARFHKMFSESMLYIIGDGALKNELTCLIKDLNLQENVILTGNMSNPFILMSKCDCFIFPSIYEGLGLVIFEARYLRLPIIVSNYSVVESDCVPNGQHIIGMSEDDIFNGLIEFTKGNIPVNYDFDCEAYNIQCYNEFESLFK